MSLIWTTIKDPAGSQLSIFPIKDYFKVVAISFPYQWATWGKLLVSLTQSFLTHVIDFSIPILSFLAEIALNVERVLHWLPTTEIILHVCHLLVPYLLHLFNFFLLFLSLPFLIVPPMRFLIRWCRLLQSLIKRHISFQSIFDLGVKIFD